MIEQIPLYIGVTAAVTLIGDGIDLGVRTSLYKKNNEIIKEFRQDLKKFKHEKHDYGFVLPLYRNPSEADKCLESLIKDLQIPKTEIITVDDFSNDNGETKNAAKKYGLEVLEVTREEKDVPKIRAQKKGVAKWLERGKKYVIFLDSDCYINNSLSDLELAMAEMDFFKLDAMAGQVLPRIDKNSTLIERIQYIEYKQAMRAGRGSMYSLKKHNDKEVLDITDLKSKYSLKQASQLCVSGAFGIFKTEPLKTALDEMKLYGVGDDVEITHRLLAKKSKIGYNNSLVIETEAPKSFSRWFKQRQQWAQYISNYFVDSGHISKILKKENSRWKPNYDAGGLTLGVELLRDIGMHPVKLAILPYFVLNPPLFVTFTAIYAGVNWYISARTKEKEEKIDLAAEFLMPFYRLVQLFGPTTVGYAKQFGRIFNFKERRKNKK